MPKGIANKAVIKVTNAVPVIAGRIPPLVIPSDGIELMNSQDKEGHPLTTRSYNITSNKRITVPVQKSNVVHSIIGVSFFILSLPLIVLSCLVFAEAVHKIFAGQVDQQGDNK